MLRKCATRTIAAATTLLATMIFGDVVDAGVDVVVLSGIQCVGWTDGGITEHVAGSIGGSPTNGTPPHPWDEYSVAIWVYHHSCSWVGGSSGYWNCGWTNLYNEESLWERVNSYITNYEPFQNLGFVKQYNAAGTWGQGYYWSYNQGTEQWTDWVYAQDSC